MRPNTGTRASGAADIVQEPTLIKLREPTLMM
jgi:hypothetical protein